MKMLLSTLVAFLSLYSGLAHAKQYVVCKGTEKPTNYERDLVVELSLADREANVYSQHNGSLLARGDKLHCQKVQDGLYCAGAPGDYIVVYKGLVRTSQVFTNEYFGLRPRSSVLPCGNRRY